MCSCKPEKISEAKKEYSDSLIYTFLSDAVREMLKVGAKKGKGRGKTWDTMHIPTVVRLDGMAAESNG